MNGTRRAKWSGLLEGWVAVILAVAVGILAWHAIGCIAPFGTAHVVVGGHAAGAGQDATLDVSNDQPSEDETQGISTGTLENTFPPAPAEQTLDRLKLEASVSASQPTEVVSSQPKKE